MRTIDLPGKPKRAAEISAGLAGRRLGLCGFNRSDAERITKTLGGVDALAVPCDERLLRESATICDGVMIRLASVSPEGLRGAARSPAPVLVACPGKAVLEGISAAYDWPSDFIVEPWTETELLVRVFRLLRPLRNLPASRPHQNRTQPLVLLADDDPELIALVDATLRHDGFTCCAATNGQVALRLARSAMPDLMVLDVKMPKLDGFDVLETVRRDPAIQLLPVILMTACDEPADVVRASELRADDYLAKPVSPTVLLNRVQRLLASHPATARWTRALPGGVASGGGSLRPWIQNGGASQLTGTT